MLGLNPTTGILKSCEFCMRSSKFNIFKIIHL